MKFEIYTETKIIDPIVRLCLIKEEHDGSITLAAVDENGKILCDGRLLEISAGGRMFLYSGIESKLGFELDSNGKIVIDEEGI